ncbi:MAG: hypothetical protein GWP19_06645 [Planctomycetia bacterium]|nr:hypothetical protein [Planctomycetia bacterium]
MEFLTSTIALIVAVAVIMAIFLIARHFVLWYFRINEAIELLDAIRTAVVFGNQQNQPDESKKENRK